MEAALGKRKRGDDAAAGGDSSAGVDRLSALPDHLLHEIMSHLKARQMVQTCSLSRRWRHLWPKTPRLDVDQREFAAAGLGDQSFDDFANFLLQQAPIALLDAFRLHVNPGCSSLLSTNASAWVRRAIMASAQRPPPEAQRSWRLRTLHLSNLRDLDESFAGHVRSRCPSLEELELRDCTCRFQAIVSGSLRHLTLVSCVGKGFFGIASPTLRSLVVDQGANDITSAFCVAAPALVCLSLDVSPYNFPGGACLDEMPALARASIRLKQRQTLVENKNLRDHLFKALSRVSNVSSLELSAFDVAVEAGEESTAFLEFNNLRTLELNQCGLCDDLRVSGHILRNSPNLQKLTLHLSPCLKLPVGEPLSYPEFKNMRALILHNYDPIDDFQTLGRFLQSSPILEKLTLHCSKLKNTKKKRRTSKTKNVVQEPMDVRCENLKLTEIIYRDDNVRHLVEFLLHFSGNLPKNNIRFIKVD
ncbi:unnamed protein product [Urochloa humidicola]